MKIDIVIRSEAFQKKINEKIDLWVESNSNSSASNNLVSTSFGSKHLHEITLDILLRYKDVRTEKIKLFLQGYRLFSDSFS